MCTEDKITPIVERMKLKVPSLLPLRCAWRLSLAGRIIEKDKIMVDMLCQPTLLDDGRMEVYFIGSNKYTFIFWQHPTARFI
jgi:hypothetical protein